MRTLADPHAADRRIDRDLRERCGSRERERRGGGKKQAGLPHGFPPLGAHACLTVS
jgi:hypothetical protein